MKFLDDVSSRLVLPIKSYEPEKICVILENRGKRPLKVIESFKLLSTKMWNFIFFARRHITDACLFVCFFPPGVIVSTQLS